MPYTATNLITDAYYLSGIVAREFEEVSGTQMENGLKWANDLLAEKVVEKNMIPYEGQTTFIAVPGQEVYSFSGLIDVDTLTFTLDTVRYGMVRMPRDVYQGYVRANNIRSLPFTYLIEREFGGAKIYIYFTPDRQYEFTINGVFRLEDITIGQDLELTIDRFFTTYMRYDLAAYICNEYNIQTPRSVSDKINFFKETISLQSRKQSMKPIPTSTINPPTSINWDYVNFVRGWYPSGG